MLSQQSWVLRVCLESSVFSCSSHPSAVSSSGTRSLSSQEPCCCWELGWDSELCNSQGASSVCAGCRSSAYWMLQFWMTNSYKTLASFFVNSTPEQQVAGRMAFKPRACLVPRCSQPLKSLAASFPAQLLLLCLPRFPLEFQLSFLCPCSQVCGGDVLPC